MITFRVGDRVFARPQRILQAGSSEPPVECLLLAEQRGDVWEIDTTDRRFLSPAFGPYTIKTDEIIGVSLRSLEERRISPRQAMALAIFQAAFAIRDRSMAIARWNDYDADMRVQWLRAADAAFAFRGAPSNGQTSTPSDDLSRLAP